MKKEKKTQSEQKKTSAETAADRTGMFTSSVVSTREGRKIALFFTGRKHAGENLKSVLGERASALEPPIHMCDGLPQNLPGELKTIVSNCLLHARRNFVDLTGIFPTECRYVIELLRKVYENETFARERKMSPVERLRLHQSKSAPVMKELHDWLKEQIDERKVEPNSSLGDAIDYMLKRWKKLTLFLEKPGAPLDNNTAERALKKAILFRKNSLFYRTLHGAHTGDVLISLIYTCQLARVNPFDYLNELQRHRSEVAANPSDWMPWNYRETLDRVRSSISSPANSR